MSSLEQLPLTFLQSSQKLRAVTQRSTRVMGVICNTGRSLFECLTIQVSPLDPQSSLPRDPNHQPIAWK